MFVVSHEMKLACRVRYHREYYNQHTAIDVYIYDIYVISEECVRIIEFSEKKYSFFYTYIYMYLDR